MKIRYLLLCSATLGLFALASPQARATPIAQTGVCPALGYVTGTACNVEIFAGANNAFSTLVPDSSPYDGSDDNLVGIINNSGKTIYSLSFTTPTGAFLQLFGFDGDGLQTYDSTKGSDTTGYGGETSAGEYTTFTNISAGGGSGTVVFGANGIANNETAYFSLEGPPSLTLTPNSSSVPEPGSLALLGTGLLGLVYMIRRKRSL